MYYINQNKNDIEMIAKPPFSENWMRNIVYLDRQKMKTPTHLVSHTQCVRSKKKKKNCNSLSEVDALFHMVAGLRRLVRVDVDQVDLDGIGIVDLVSLFIIGFLCLCGCG